MSEYTRAADVAVGDVVIVWRGDSKLDFTRRFRHAELERHAGAPCAFTRVSASVERVTSPAEDLLAAAARCVTVREACTVVDADAPGAERVAVGPAPDARRLTCRREVLGLAARTGLLDEYRLAGRPHTLSTTMDAESALLAASLARVRPGARVLDPCVGAGGLLLAAASLGAATLVGVDRDDAAVGFAAARGFDANLLHYGLAARCEASLLCGDCRDPEVVAAAAARAEGGRFDAILADPPYGKREGGMAQRDAALALVAAAAAHLVVGGTCVLWVGIDGAGLAGADAERMARAAVPPHGALACRAVCAQRLHKSATRVLVALEKTRELTPAEADADARDAAAAAPDGAPCRLCDAAPRGHRHENECRLRFTSRNFDVALWRARNPDGELPDWVLPELENRRAFRSPYWTPPGP